MSEKRKSEDVRSLCEYCAICRSLKQSLPNTFSTRKRALRDMLFFMLGYSTFFGCTLTIGLDAIQTRKQEKLRKIYNGAS